MTNPFLSSSTSLLSLQVSNIYGDSSRIHAAPSLLKHEANPTCQFTTTQHSPHLTVERYDPENSYTLNYSDLGQLVSNINSLPPHIQHKVRTIADKQRIKSNDFWYDGYYPQTTLISLSESKISQSVCRCGFKPRSSFASPGLCHKPRLCLKCARLEARKSLKVFRPLFGLHRWGFLTISFHNNLLYSRTVSTTQWLRYWDAASASVTNLRKQGFIQGAIVREELAINSIAPMRVLPHIHAIVSYPDITDSVKYTLASDVNSALQAAGEDAPLIPSIHFGALSTEEDFVRTWEYIYKPTLFYEAYSAKWDDEAMPRAKKCLNRSIHEAVEAAIHIPHGRRQIRYLGNMRSGTRHFIGVS